VIDIRRFVLITGAGAVAVAFIGLLIAWASAHDVVSSVASAYYIFGCLVFLVGMFPSGGFSLFRGTITQRKPIGARREPTLLIGVALIAIGLAIDFLF
jgi:hypothetical protein